MEKTRTCITPNYCQLDWNQTGKVIDVCAKNSFCEAYVKWEHKKDSAVYEEWYDTHKQNCSANHEGSAEKMEVDNALEMLCRSEQKYKLKCANSIGDGDSKVFHALANAKPYGKNIIIKKECVGHVQKRIGSKLRERRLLCIISAPREFLRISNRSNSGKEGVLES